MGVAAILAIASGEIGKGRELCESILRENVNDRFALNLYVLSNGPFPLHWWAYRWKYALKSTGMITRVLVIAGLCACMLALPILAARSLVVSLLLIGIWSWSTFEKRRRTKLVIQHFAAPKVRN